MTAHQTDLLREARHMWERGFQVPVELYAAMAKAGMDVPKLEALYFKEQING